MAQLRNQEVKELNKIIESKYRVSNFFHKKDQIKEEDNKIIIDNDHLHGEAAFFYYEGELVPSVRLLLLNEYNSLLPKVTVNMPAIPFMVKGADLMRPGIVIPNAINRVSNESDGRIGIDDFEKGAFVAIIDEKNKKTVAVGRALFSSAEIKAMDKGKVIKNLHRVGDEIWGEHGK